MRKTHNIKLVFSISFSWILLSGCTNSLITYYDPVLSSDGKTLAYLKRESCFESNPTFWGTSLNFSKDVLYLCTSSRFRKKEQCLEEWSLPLEKLTTSVKGSIYGSLGWEDNNLLYHIELVGWPTGDQIPGEGGIAVKQIITNLDSGQRIPVGNQNKEWKVLVDPDPEKYAYPISNKILMEEKK